MSAIACIGSRETPEDVLKQMEELGRFIVLSGLGIVTGNCKSADQAFARGANSVDLTKVWLCLPWHSYEQDAIVEGNWTGSLHSLEMENLAAEHHPSWAYLNPGVKKLLTRNASIIEIAHQTTKLVIGYLNPNKKGGGGTGHGWRIAESFNMTRVNLADEGSFEQAKKLITDLAKN